MLNPRVQRTPHRRVIRWKTLTVGIGVSAVLAGCTSSSASTPTKAEYDRQANAICQSYNAKLKALGSKVTNNSSAQQVASELRKAVSVAKQGSARLEALPKPDGQGAALDKVYAAQDEQVKQIQSFATALDQGNMAKAQSIQNALNAGNGALNREFDAVGLTTCGSGSST